jgi:hypothetical protein
MFEIKTQKDIYGRDYQCIGPHKSIVAGRNYFLKKGYVVCQNRRYMQKGDSLVHYNSLTGYWFFEKIQKTENDFVATA